MGDGDDDDEIIIDWAKIPKAERRMLLALARLLVSLRTAGRLGKALAWLIVTSGWIVFAIIAWKNGTFNPTTNWPHP